ncbi:MAG: xylulokinase [Acidobacteriota bacterium]|nr:xylulokinase [Acidobacteriota bacterium]
MNFLGIDVGTGGSRAVLIDENGNIAASETVEHIPFATPEIGWAEQDPQDWWRASAEAIRKILANKNAGNIAAIGLSGQMHGAVLLDENDEVLRPALIWCDQRTGKQCDELTEKIGKEKLIELVSNPALTNFTLPKMLWVRENEPEIWDKVKTVLLPKDYVRLCLTGEKATDVADGSGTLLLDVQNRKWSGELLSLVEMDASILPKLYESQEITGEVTAKCAGETGLEAGTPVVAGAGDNAAGAIGMGLTKVGAVGVTIGTSGVVFAVTDKPSIDLKRRIHTLCHAIPEHWHVTGVTQAAGLSFKWFRDNFAKGESFDELIRMAEEIPAGSDGVLWTPYLMGERTPHIDPDARATLTGLSAKHTKAHIVRAILEGVAFSLRDSLEIYKELGIPLESIRLGGGGAKSELWRQIQADVFNQAVETIEAEEGAAYGAALLAGVGAGNWKSVDEACNLTIRIKQKIEPNEEDAKILNHQYKFYGRIYSAFKNINSKNQQNSIVQPEN